ncbi:MAG: hypothetical protein HY329_27965 [Chloroflexi bacterium]|nr:hypothetical protein [Chloroflexota bacterium]
MMWLKSCPRCQGDLYLEHDIEFSSVKCIQCGHYMPDAPERVRVVLNTSARKSAA